MASSSVSFVFSISPELALFCKTNEYRIQTLTYKLRLPTQILVAREFVENVLSILQESLHCFADITIALTWIHTNVLHPSFEVIYLTAGNRRRLGFNSTALLAAISVCYIFFLFCLQYHFEASLSR